MQWEAKSDKTGDGTRKLGRLLFCLPERGLFKENRQKVRVEEESKTGLALSLCCAGSVG